MKNRKALDRYYKISKNLCKATTRNESDAFNDGWNECKKEVLKILSQPLYNLDLSQDNCEQRYIEKVTKL
jgi:hypothetical protein